MENPIKNKVTTQNPRLYEKWDLSLQTMVNRKMFQTTRKNSKKMIQAKMNIKSMKTMNRKQQLNTILGEGNGGGGNWNKTIHGIYSNKKIVNTIKKIIIKISKKLVISIFFFFSLQCIVFFYAISINLTKLSSQKKSHRIKVLLKHLILLL